MPYQFNDGEVYDGPTITLPDGRVVSGATFTPESRRLYEVVPEPVRARNDVGRLVADDKATPEVNEAWVGGKAPKKKKRASKKKA